MYCKKCGKEIENDSLFCAYCGCEQKSSNDLGKQEIVKENLPKKYLTKEFDFGYFDDNDKAIREINRWLADSNINFIGINIDTKFNLLPIPETAMRQVAIVYEEIEETEYRYQIDAERYSSIFFENSHKKLKKQFAEWKADNPDKLVVWEQIRSHDYLYNNWVSNVATLYYLFRENKDDEVYRKRMESLERGIFMSNTIWLLFGIFIIGFFSVVLSHFFN